MVVRLAAYAVGMILGFCIVALMEGCRAKSAPAPLPKPGQTMALESGVWSMEFKTESTTYKASRVTFHKGSYVAYYGPINETSTDPATPQGWNWRGEYKYEDCTLYVIERCGKHEWVWFVPLKRSGDGWCGSGFYLNDSNPEQSRLDIVLRRSHAETRRVDHKR